MPVMVMKCGKCGSESGDVEYMTTGRKIFYCFSCFNWTLFENPLLDRMEKDVG